MSKSPETYFKERVLKALRQIPKSWWFKVQLKAVRGIPDIIGLINGKFYALELKRHEFAKIDALQIYVLKKIQEAGGEAHILYPENWDEFYRGIC